MRTKLPFSNSLLKRVGRVSNAGKRNHGQANVAAKRTVPKCELRHIPAAARPLSFVPCSRAPLCSISKGEGLKARVGAPKKDRIRECMGASALVDYRGLRKVI